MRDLDQTQRETRKFYQEQERLLSARIALLPKGRIRARTIGGEAYHYLQYRKGDRVHTDYLGKAVPPEVLNELEERRRLEGELRRVRAALKVLRAPSRGPMDLTEPLLSVFRAFTERKLWDSGLEIIGSWCYLLYQRGLPVERYPLRTEDLDILVPRPYRGPEFDLADFLKRLGFSPDFHPDGSISFSGRGMRIDFLAPDRGAGTRPPRFIREIAVTPQLLRFVDILVRDPITLKIARGIQARVPAPAAFVLHKLLIACRPGREEKRDKDLRQGVYTAKYVLKNPAEAKRMADLWSSFPRSWKTRVKTSLRSARSVVPLEEGVIRSLEASLS